MLEFDSNIFSSALSTTLVALGLGVLSYWANPARPINKAFLGLSIHVALWLMCLEIAVGGGVYGLLFLRLTTVIGGLIPGHLWYVKECVSSTQGGLRLLRRGWPWIAAGLILGIFCFTSWFVPLHSTPSRRVYGWAYYAHIVCTVMLYLGLLIQTVRQARASSGAQKMELQVLILNFCLTALVVISLMAASAILRDSSYIQFQPIAVLISYALTAWAMLSTRVCDAAHLLAVTLHKATLLLLTGAASYAVFNLASFVVPTLIAYATGVGSMLWFISAIDPRLRSVFGLKPSSGPIARAALYDISRQDLRPEKMADAYANVLKGWAQAEQAYVLTGEKGRYEYGELALESDGPELSALRSLQWATPERLARQRNHAEIDALERFMHEHQLGAMVISQDKSLRIVLATAVASSRQPCTYPEILQLIEFASIIETGMQRAHFSTMARRSEQLATVGMLGASLAHEIRNPLVTLKTFAQLFPQRHSDPVFRAKFATLLSSEVGRIEQLTEQLLDMASPHNYLPQKVSLNQVAESCLDLVSPKASSQNVQLKSDMLAKPDIVLTDPHAARQVLLNLCINGIQAMEGRNAGKWLHLATRRVENGIELSVTDNGPGIKPDIRNRLFQPFVTSKSSGFGLGLAICGDILGGLGATISADPYVEGHGATFRVVFPESKE